MRHHSIFCADRSNRCGYMAVFQFFKMVAVRRLGFIKNGRHGGSPTWLPQEIGIWWSYLTLVQKNGACGTIWTITVFRETKGRRWREKVGRKGEGRRRGGEEEGMGEGRKEGEWEGARKGERKGWKGRRRRQILPHRCNVSPLRGEKTQNRPLTNTFYNSKYSQMPSQIHPSRAISIRPSGDGSQSFASTTRTL